MCFEIKNVIDVWIGQKEEPQEQPSTSKQLRRYVRRRLDLLALLAQEEGGQEKEGPHDDLQHRDIETHW